MKKLILLFSVVISLAGFQACENKSGTGTETKADDDIPVSEVPQPVQSAFAARYATATAVKWENAKEDTVKTYKAKFTVDGKKLKAEFRADGSFIKED
ncbi:MAG TPA: hypothetical protein VGD33_05395 [Chitinophagaceae bacterium]